MNTNEFYRTSDLTATGWNDQKGLYDDKEKAKESQEKRIKDNPSILRIAIVDTSDNVFYVER